MSESRVPELPRGALANALTLLRLVLALPIAMAILDGRSLLALLLLLFAVATDGLDGHLARRYGSTALGSWLDVAADRVLIASVTGALWWGGALPVWITLVLLVREAMGIVGALSTHQRKRGVQPLAIGKVYAALVFVLLLVATAAAADFAPPRLVDLLAWLVAAAALLSALAYARSAAR